MDSLNFCSSYNFLKNESPDYFRLSFTYPPLKPKGRMSGSRSKFELTFSIVMIFGIFIFDELIENEGNADNVPPTLPVVLIKFLLDQFFITNRIIT